MLRRSSHNSRLAVLYLFAETKLVGEDSQVNAESEGLGQGPTTGVMLRQE
jgi:hypothetical protein